MYINNLPECVMSWVRLFADDTQIYARTDTEENWSIMQDDLYNQPTRIVEEMAMRFHPQKWKVLNLGRQKSDTVYLMKTHNNNDNTILEDIQVGKN